MEQTAATAAMQIPPRLGDAKLHFLFSICSIVFLIGPSAASAEFGDEFVHLPKYPISVGIRILGPWGSTFAGVHAINGPNDDGIYGFCAQAPAPGGIRGGTESDPTTLTDYNSRAVQDSLAAITAILEASRLPTPQEIQRVQFRNAGGSFTRVVLDFDDNIVAAEDEDRDLFVWNWFYPVGFDNLPFNAIHRIDIAAIQAAIWHFTDNPSGDPAAIDFQKQAGVLTGFPPDSSAVTLAEIRQRYLELVAIGEAAQAPASSLEIVPQQIDNVAVFEIVADQHSEATLDGGGLDYYPYDPNTGVCSHAADPVTTVDLSTGNAFVCRNFTFDTTFQVTADATTSVVQAAYLDRTAPLQDTLAMGTTSLTDSATGTLDAVFMQPALVPAASAATLAAMVLTLFVFGGRSVRRRWPVRTEARLD